jgi:serine/threonine protein kinase
VSKEAKDLINRTVASPEILRLSSTEALAHKWIQSNFTDTTKPEILKNVLENLNNFQVKL